MAAEAQVFPVALNGPDLAAVRDAAAHAGLDTAGYMRRAAVAQARADEAARLTDTGPRAGEAPTATPGGPHDPDGG